MTHPQTINELKESGYKPRTVKAELRANLIHAMQRGERLFSGIIGYVHTVLPEIENAILSGHDIILLGERGQAKTRIMRSLAAAAWMTRVRSLPAVKSTIIPFIPSASAATSSLQAYGMKRASGRT